MKQTGTRLPILCLLNGAIIWGLIWYPLRELAAVGISGPLATVVNYLVAAAIGGCTFHRQLRSGGKPSFALLALACTGGWANLGYVIAIIHGEVLRVLLLFYLAPLWTVLFARLLLGEKLHRQGLAVVALALAGAMIMLWPNNGGLPTLRDRADIYGLTAGMMFALYNVLVRRVSSAGLELKAMSVWLGAAAMALVYIGLNPTAAPWPSHLAATDLLQLLTLGIVIFAVNLSVQYGLARLPANRAIVIMLFELVVAALSAWWLAGEQPTLHELGGGIAIALAAICSGTIDSSNPPQAPTQPEADPPEPDCHHP